MEKYKNIYFNTWFDINSQNQLYSANCYFFHHVWNTYLYKIKKSSPHRK